MAKLVAAEDVPNESFTLSEQTGQQACMSGLDASNANLTVTGATSGTASYMSPEQVRKETLDPRTDLFSFGAVLYEMATGNQPFLGDTTEQIHHAILNSAPPSPLLRNPNLPPRLGAIISRILEKDRDQRCQSAFEIAADLRRLRRDSSSDVHDLPSGPNSDVSSELKPDARNFRAFSNIARVLSSFQAASKSWNRATGALTAVLIAAGAIGYAVHLWTSHGTPPTMENIRITRLTDSGKAEDVAISPDGRYIAYLFYDGDDTSLRLRQVGDRGETQVLVHEPLLYPGLAFSPDGSHLYFLRARPKDALFRDLYEIPSLGGPERKVTPNIDSAVSFSPDGRQFAYESGAPRQDSIEIRIANGDGGGDRLLVNLQGAFAGYNPGAAWSPDGGSIAVPVWMHRKNPSGVLEVISTSDGAVRELYSDSHQLGRPRWLPDGNMLVVPIVDDTGRTQLWTVSYPAGKTRRLTNDLADYDSAIDTTRDGRMLATVQHTVISNLSVSSSREGSGGTQLTFGEQIITSVFTVDGKLAMVNHADHGVWVMDPDQAHPKLTADARGGGWFTSCGRFILFVSNRRGAPELVRIDEDGANPKTLATGEIWGEGCSPDAKFVYYPEMLKPRWRIRRVPIDGGTPVDIVENPGEAIPGRVAISPDGKLLAFPFDVASSEPTLKLGVVSVAGGPLIKQIDVPNSIQGPRWAPDGQSLQYVWDKNGATNLWEQPVTGGPPHQLTKFTSGRIFDFNWSTDGKQLLLARGEDTSDVVLLSNLR